MEPAKNRFLLCAALLAVIFGVDTFTPLGIAAGIPYIAVILLALRLPKRSVLFFAATSAVLTAIGFFKYSSAAADVESVALANRILTILALWLIAYISLARKRAEEELRKHRDQLELLVEERTASVRLLHRQLEAAMLDRLKQEQAKLRLFHATMRTVKDIVNNFLNELQLIRLELEEKVEADSPSLQLLDTLIFETSAKLNALGELKELRETDIGEGIFMLEVNPARSDETE